MTGKTDPKRRKTGRKMTPDNQAQSPTANPKALCTATTLYKSFYGTDASLIAAETLPTPRNERLAYGHRETIFGVAFSPDGKYLASASQDSTVRIWQVSNHKLAETLDGDKDFECLRVAWLPVCGSDAADNAVNTDEEKYMLAAAGADGILRVYSASQQNDKLQWKLVATKDHYGLLNETEDRPQIYSLQFVTRPSNLGTTTSPNTTDNWLLMTSADDAIFLWDFKQTNGKSFNEREITSHAVIQFAQLGQNRFGGPRNPNNAIYVFDAAANTNGLVGAALSDGTCRIMSLAQSAQEKQCVLSVPEQFVGEKGGHLTAISWDSSGERLATCIACGYVVLWDIKYVEGTVYSSILALLEGGQFFFVSCSCSCFLF